MAQPWCTGAAHIFVGVGGSKTSSSARYLGTCEAQPDLQDDVKLEPIMNDIAGSMMPFDYSFMGIVGTISGVFTRFNQAVYQALTNLPNPFAAPAQRGTLGATDIGSIVGLEGLAVPLWVQFPYSTKAAMVGMDAGRRYFRTFLFGPQSTKPGTRVKKIALTWIAFHYYDPTTRALALYDRNMSGLPNPD